MTVAVVDFSGTKFVAVPNYVFSGLLDLDVLALGSRQRVSSLEFSSRWDRYHGTLISIHASNGSDLLRSTIRISKRL